MQTTRMAGGIGDLLSSIALGGQTQQQGYDDESGRLNKHHYTRAKAMNEHDQLQARQSITPDMLAGLSLPAGVDGSLASLFMRSGGVKDFANSMGVMQQNDARGGAIDSFQGAGLDPTSLGAMLNAVASGKAPPDLYDRNASGTVQNFTGAVSDIPPPDAGKPYMPTAPMLELLATQQMPDITNDAGDVLSYKNEINPAIVQEIARQYGIIPDGGQANMGGPNGAAPPVDLSALFSQALSQSGGMPPSNEPPPVTATGPNGEKVALINGQWVPMQ